jgi:hypothetical protein
VNTGVKLSRPSLKTSWFKREEFEKRPITTESPLSQSSISLLSSEECNRLMDKVAAAAVSETTGPAREAATQTNADVVDTGLGAQTATTQQALNIPQPTQKRKVEKPVAKVSKKTSAQKKLMKL